MSDKIQHLCRSFEFVLNAMKKYVGVINRRYNKDALWSNSLVKGAI